METITFNCRFITPAFLGGANPKGTPELRPPTIKGALRFWWRAQSGISDLKELKKKEFQIFGGVDGDKAIKCSFSLRVAREEFQLSRDLPKMLTEVREKSYKVNIFEYLAYGTYDWQNRINVLNRDFVVSDQKFDVSFSFTTNEHKNEIIKAFQLLSLFGGLGSKSRNGFGKFEIVPSPVTASWKDTIQTLKDGVKKNFTSFCSDLLCFQTENTFTKPENAQAEIGKAYKNAREYIEKRHKYEHRSYLASPIVEHRNQRSFLDRHAKPYFLTVVPEQKQYRGLILFLPYFFLGGAEDMIKELYKRKKLNKKPADLHLNELEKVLVKRSLDVHQKYYNKSTGCFHEQLCRQENKYRLTQV
jgi:CRISPR-associated protein Cmr1